MKSVERLGALVTAGVIVVGSITCDSPTVRELRVTSELGRNPVEFYDPWGA